MEAFRQHTVTVLLGLIFIPNISLGYIKKHDLTYFSFAVLKHHITVATYMYENLIYITSQEG